MHSTKNWAAQTAEGQRRYNLPPQLLPFMVPQVRTGMHGVSLGQAGLQSGDPQLDVAAAWGAHSTLLGLLRVVGTLSQDAYAVYSPQVEAITTQLGLLNQDAAALADTGVSAWYSELTAVEGAMADLESELHSVIDQAGRSQQYTAVGWTSAALVLAGLGGLDVFSRKGARRRR